MTGYQRTILFGPVYDAATNVVPSVRAVTITVQYATSQTSQPKSYILNSYISEYQ